MSSTTSATTTTTVERQTYWCHECDMSISLHTTSLLCPYCHSDFLEEMDSPLSLSLSSPNSNPNSNTSVSLLDPIPQNPTDDNFLLDSPYLHRLIHHLTTPDDGSSPSTTTTLHHSPASKTAVEAIPTIKITNTFLDLDPIILCAVCKDQFIINDETKQLPCKHMYHPDCILPWLSNHNSCPVCRFQLPTEELKCGGVSGRRRRSRILRLGELMEDDDELFEFGSTLRHIARRHRLVFPMGRRESRENREREEGLFSPTQIGEEAEMGLPANGRADSVETVSSGWPGWPVEGGAAGDGDGDARVNDDGNIIMS